MFSRRNFLKASFAATAGGILVAADVLSTKTFFLPPKGGWYNYGKLRFLNFAGKPLWPGLDQELGYTRVKVRLPYAQLEVDDLVTINGKMHRVANLQYDVTDARIVTIDFAQEQGIILDSNISHYTGRKSIPI